MKPARFHGLAARGVALCALWGAASIPALALDPRTQDGPLASREFAAPELAASSSHVPLDKLLQQMPNRAAWQRFRSQRGSAGPAHVFVDPRSGAATNVMTPIPLLPGDGVGNQLSLDDVAARIARPVARIDAAVVEQAARQFLVQHADLLGIDVAQLGRLRATRVSESLWQISAAQVVDGLLVRDAHLALTISHGNVITFGTEGWGAARVRSEPTVSADKALEAAFDYAGGRSVRDVVIGQPRLEILTTAPPGARGDEIYDGPVGQGYAHRLVWNVAFQRRPDDARWEVLIDAASGDVLSFQDKNHYVNRQITGGVYPLTNTGQCPTPQACGSLQSGWPMPFADTGLAAPNNLTNSAGVYDYAGLPPTTTLTGPFVDIVDTCGPVNASSATGDIDLGGVNGQHDCVTGNPGGLGNTAASRSAFYEVNKLAEQARGWLPGNLWLQSRLVSNVNIALTCNAFWNGVTINFYRSGGGCGNTGEIAAVFDHEWGHGLDDNDANGVLSNSSEGYADIAAIYRLQASCVGHGFSIGATPGVCGLTADGTGPNRNENQLGGQHCDLDCSGVRDADWNKHADHTADTALGFVCSQCLTGPGPCGRQVHCAAAPARQAAWDLVTRDLTAPPFNLDSQSAFALANRIFYQGSGNIAAWHACTCGASSSGCGATNGYIQWLTADDDNGNLNDGTPHMTALSAAFDRHGIGCAAPTPVNSGCADLPSAPTLVATAGPYQAALDWSPGTGAGRYWVMRSEGHAGCDFGKAKIADLTGTSFVDTQVAPGRTYAYNVVAQGTSPACHSSVSNCVQVTPTISTDPDFSVACNPAALTVTQGNSSTSACTVSSANGFSSEVSLACTGLPTDATCSFDPPLVTPPANGSVVSTLTVGAAASTPAGTSSPQVAGTSGTLVRAANLSLVVVAPTFSVACVPSSLSVIQGNSVTSTCTVTSQNGFNAEVTLACGTLPAGAACTFDLPAVTPPPNGAVTSTLTVTTASTTPGAATSFQVTGTSGALVRSTNLVLSVLVPSYTVTCAPSSVSVIQGNSVTSTCTVTSQNGFNAPVDLTCANLPVGAACAFVPTPVTPPANGSITSTLSVSTSATTPGGLRTFQVVGTSGTLTRSANVSINVVVPSFALSCSPTSLSVPQGNGVTSACRVTSVNTFSAPVTLSCSTQPSGGTCAFSPAQVTPAPNGFVTSTLTLTTSAATPLGTTSFQALGVGPSQTSSVNLSLTVGAPPDFTLSCNPASLAGSGGASVSSTCFVGSLRGFTSAVGLTCAGLPAGITCTLSPASVTPPANSSVASALTLAIDTTVATGSYPFTVTGTSGALTRATGLTLGVTRLVFADDFETATGWVTNPDGTDTATRGAWERAVPVQYTGGGIVIQNGVTPSGVNDLVTQSSTAGSNGDIDNGSTSILSPPITLPASGVSTLSFAYYLAHRADSSADDFFRASIVTASGTSVVFEELGTAVNDPAVFTTRSLALSAYAGQTIRVLFSAGDGGLDNLLEAAVDDVKIVVQ